MCLFNTRIFVSFGFYDTAQKHIHARVWKAGESKKLLFFYDNKAKKPFIIRLVQDYLNKIYYFVLTLRNRLQYGYGGQFFYSFLSIKKQHIFVYVRLINSNIYSLTHSHNRAHIHTKPQLRSPNNMQYPLRTSPRVCICVFVC